jgi:hypothetical protein
MFADADAEGRSASLFTFALSVESEVVAADDTSAVGVEVYATKESSDDVVFLGFLLALVIVASAACAPLDASDVTASFVFLPAVDEKSSVEVAPSESEAVVFGIAVDLDPLTLAVGDAEVADLSVSSGSFESFVDVVLDSRDTGGFPVGVAIELPASVEESA